MGVNFFILILKNLGNLDGLNFSVGFSVFHGLGPKKKLDQTHFGSTGRLFLIVFFGLRGTHGQMTMSRDYSLLICLSEFG